MVDKARIKRTIIQLQRAFGSIIPLEELYSLNVEEDREDIHSVLKELEKDGFIDFLDEDSVKVNT